MLHKTTLLALLLISSPLFLSQALEKPTCKNGILIRSSWKDLSPDARTVYIRDIKKFFLRKTNGRLVVDTYTKLHYDYGGISHTWALFFPWHRALLYKLEQDIQNTLKTKTTIPYWDWSMEYNTLDKSILWESFGGNESPLNSGPFAHVTVTTEDQHEVARAFSSSDDDGYYHVGSIGNAVPYDELQTYYKINNYQRFHEKIENAHGILHCLIGADMSSTTTSPNDPVFYLHHCFVDYIWSTWQGLSDNKNKFSGPACLDLNGCPNSVGTKEASLDMVMEPFGWKVRDTLDTKKLCYTYSKSMNGTLPRPAVSLPSSESSETPQKSLAEFFKPEDLPEGKVPVATHPTPSIPSSPAPEVKPTNPKPNKDKRPKPRTKKGDSFKIYTVDEYIMMYIRSDLPEMYENAISLLKISHGSKLGNKWIARSRLNVKDVRKLEDENAKLLDQINEVPGFISPCSLWNRPEALEALVKDGNTIFKLCVNEGVLVVRIPEEERSLPCKEQVEKMQERVLKTLGISDLNVGYAEVADEVGRIAEGVNSQ